MKKSPKLKPWMVKLMLNAFPALFFQRVRLKWISPDFSEAKVKVRRSIFNKNLARTIFGGTIFSAADPYIAILLWQVMAHRGINGEAWLKSASINYLKPADTHLYFHFKLSEAEIEEAMQAVQNGQKFERWHTIQAKNERGETCAEIKTLTHLRPRQPFRSPTK